MEPGSLPTQSSGPRPSQSPSNGGCSWREPPSRPSGEIVGTTSTDPLKLANSSLQSPAPSVTFPSEGWSTPSSSTSQIQFTYPLQMSPDDSVSPGPKSTQSLYEGQSNNGIMPQNATLPNQMHSYWDLNSFPSNSLHSSTPALFPGRNTSLSTNAHEMSNHGINTRSDSSHNFPISGIPDAMPSSQSPQQLGSTYTNQPHLNLCNPLPVSQPWTVTWAQSADPQSIVGRPSVNEGPRVQSKALQSRLSPSLSMSALNAPQSPVPQIIGNPSIATPSGVRSASARVQRNTGSTSSTPLHTPTTATGPSVPSSPSTGFPRPVQGANPQAIATANALNALTIAGSQSRYDAVGTQMRSDGRLGMDTRTHSTSRTPSHSHHTLPPTLWMSRPSQGPVKPAFANGPPLPPSFPDLFSNSVDSGTQLGPGPGKGIAPTLSLLSNSLSPSSRSKSSQHASVSSRSSFSPSVATTGAGVSSSAASSFSSLSFLSTTSVTGASTIASSPSRLSELLADDIFTKIKPPGSRRKGEPKRLHSSGNLEKISSFGSPPASPLSPTVITLSPQSAILEDAVNRDAAKMANEDPLATQVWKWFARTKAGLPHAQRMENLTWRMMALALKRRKEKERARLAALEPIFRTGSGFSRAITNLDELTRNQLSVPEPSTDESHFDTRGRLPKAKVRVEGFGGDKDDDDPTYVTFRRSIRYPLDCLLVISPAMALWTGRRDPSRALVPGCPWIGEGRPVVLDPELPQSKVVSIPPKLTLTLC